MARRPNSAERVAQVQETLLDVAQRLLEEDGPDAMSFRAIANLAGCSHTKPYSYFDSKADIIDALRIRAYEWLLGILTTAAASHEQPLDALRAMAEAYVRAGIDRPRLYELLYTDQGELAETDERLLDAKAAALDVCCNAIAAAAEAGEVQLMTDPLTAAHVFWAGAHGLVQLEHGGFLVMDRSVDDLGPVVVSTLINGLTQEVQP